MLTIHQAEIRRLIGTMASDGWGAPRIHGELMKLGYVVSEITVSRYIPRRPADPDQLKRWVAFLRNHKDAAMDFLYRSNGLSQSTPRVLCDRAR